MPAADLIISRQLWDARLGKAILFVDDARAFARRAERERNSRVAAPGRVSPSVSQSLGPVILADAPDHVFAPVQEGLVVAPAQFWLEADVQRSRALRREAEREDPLPGPPDVHLLNEDIEGALRQEGDAYRKTYVWHRDIMQRLICRAYLVGARLN